MTRHGVTECELYHHGILGMKWGIRRTPEQLGRRVNKIETKTRGLEKKSVAYRTQSANLNMKAAKYEKKALKKSVAARTDKEYQKALDTRFKGNRYATQAAKLEKKAAKTDSRVLKNKETVRVLNKTISSLNRDDVEAGKRMVDRLFMKYET